MIRAVRFLPLLLVAACVLGAKESSFVRPRGEQITVDFGQGYKREAELLAITPGGLVLRAGSIVEARWEDIRTVSPERLRKLDWPERAKPGAKTLEALRLVSRFPQGLDESLTRRLLDAYGQEEIATCHVVGEQLVCGRAS